MEVPIPLILITVIWSSDWAERHKDPIGHFRLHKSVSQLPQ